MYFVNLCYNGGRERPPAASGGKVGRYDSKHIRHSVPLRRSRGVHPRRRDPVRERRGLHAFGERLHRPQPAGRVRRGVERRTVGQLHRRFLPRRPPLHRAFLPAGEGIPHLSLPRGRRPCHSERSAAFQPAKLPDEHGDRHRGDANARRGPAGRFAPAERGVPDPMLLQAHAAGGERGLCTGDAGGLVRAQRLPRRSEGRVPFGGGGGLRLFPRGADRDRRGMRRFDHGRSVALQAAAQQPPR